VNLTVKDIAEFKALYKKNFNIELDDFEARDKLSKLVRQMEIVYQPISAQQLDRLFGVKPDDE